MAVVEAIREITSCMRACKRAELGAEPPEGGSTRLGEERCNRRRLWTQRARKNGEKEAMYQSNRRRTAAFVETHEGNNLIHACSALLRRVRLAHLQPSGVAERLLHREVHLRAWQQSQRMYEYCESNLRPREAPSLRASCDLRPGGVAEHLLDGEVRLGMHNIDASTARLPAAKILDMLP